MKTAIYNCKTKTLVFFNDRTSKVPVTEKCRSLKSAEFAIQTQKYLKNIHQKLEVIHKDKKTHKKQSKKLKNKNTISIHELYSIREVLRRRLNNERW